MLRDLDRYLQLQESLIDFAQPGMDPQVWVKGRGGSYRLQHGVEKAILEHLQKHVEADLQTTTKDPHIVGSITTNQYLDDSDIDVHLFPAEESDWDEDKVHAVKAWFELPENTLYIGKHPVEVFVQRNPSTDYLSPGFYDIEKRKWIKGPKILPEDYNPYDDFSDIMDDMRDSVEDADLLFGEIRRDVIDIDIINKAIQKISPQAREKLLGVLEGKYQEIQDDINQLVSMKKHWVKSRRVTEPATPEEALEDVALAKEWRDSNALFKLISRYIYITTIKKLKQAISDDGEITGDDIDKIKGILGDHNLGIGRSH